ncbi:MAG: M28 family peptidase, partial [Aquificota bacterium]|nr:M28 family peptidase [Aquificota bacterium]
AEELIEGELSRMGYRVRKQVFRADGRECANLEVRLEGKQEEVLVVGAHYDTAPGTPGADDNASGVASLLAIAEALKGKKFRREVRLVFFTNEEPPYFQTDLMGSLVYARSLKVKVHGMVSLESIGYYTQEPDSQRYPYFFFRFLYPTVGNFIGFVGNLKSKGFLERAFRYFREGTDFPAEKGAVPGWIPGAGWSDHWSFWRIGAPAIMVTDTAPFRNPYYHTPLDTPDKLDFEALSRVTRGLVHMVVRLAND